MTCILKEPTCTEEGRTEGSHCSVCNEVIRVQATIPAKGLSYSDWKVTKEATWNEDGEQERSCLVCGLTEKQPISKLSADHVHDFSGNEVVIKPATTTETGIKEIHCADEKCDAVSQVEIPKLVNQTTSTQEEQTVSTNNGNANTGSTNNAGKNNTNKNNASAAQINKSGVNTGDNTQIVLFVALMLISFVCLGVIMYKGVLRQRRK